ncbi:carboxypeptidase-like regulatory domain-containing protein [bacterium]|nr:carboxypeptidase-like regulatory domain-containing protein [bacterium]RQV94089.1 MAG: carboxypeptidase-like regulatory domain-containing protein [bacterium]
MNIWNLLKNRLFLFAFSSSLLSQTIRYGNISGTIRDADTGAPIYFVNAFLANTTLGAASDQNGLFKIENIPPGSYEIVFSHIGYEAQIIPIHITFNEIIITGLDVRLKSKVLEGENVIVETEKPREWLRNLERFTRIFIGLTENASQCIILNPEVLEFQVDPKTDVITASTESMIKLQNEALGYDIEILLVEFEWETDDNGYYTIYPYFKEMEPENDKEEQQWIDNRYEVYRGSLRHFLTSLASDQVEENRFFIYKPRSGGRSSLMLERIESESIKSTLIDSTHYIKRFTYDGNILVRYGVDRRFASYLEFKNQYVDIDSFGYNMTPYSLKTGGYWATLRMANTLPKDYRPDK